MPPFLFTIKIIKSDNESVFIDSGIVSFYLEETLREMIGSEEYEIKERFPEEKIGNQSFYHYRLVADQNEIKKIVDDVVLEVFNADVLIFRWNFLNSMLSKKLKHRMIS